MKNEAENLPALFAELKSVFSRLPVDYEIVAINDGSTDATLEVLLQEKCNLPQLKILDLSRNFGKEAALYAGFNHCIGDCAISIDADLQDPPELIVDMIKHWMDGFEVVTAARESRKADSYVKRKTANLFYRFMNRITAIKLTPDAGDYRLLSRNALDAFLKLDERIRFNKGLFAWIGFKEKTLYYCREKRNFGKSKWGLFHLFKLALDGITSFSNAPLEIWFYIGCTTSFTSFIYGIYYFIKTLISGIDVHGYPSLLIFILFFSGLQMIGIGILGKYIGRIFIEVKHRPIYFVRKFYE